MLHTLLLNSKKYLGPAIDDKQVASIVGEASNENITQRIDMYHGPATHKGVFKEPLRVSYPVFNKADKKKSIPDIGVFQGRLFLGTTAYEILKPLIENDGEFLSAIYEQGDGYIFTPLRVVEEVDGLDTEISKKNDWGDVIHLAFHEDRVTDWKVFRTEYNAYTSLYCQQEVKDAIEKAQLTGLYFSPDLSNIYPEEQSAVTKPN